MNKFEFISLPTLSDEELATIEELCMDAARKRLQQEKCVRIEKIREAIELKDFVVVAAGNEVDEPFFVAEVILCIKF
jgi:hypothetical protein